MIDVHMVHRRHHPRCMPVRQLSLDEASQDLGRASPSIKKSGSSQWGPGVHTL